MLESIQIKPNVMFMLKVAFINQIKRYVHVKRCIHQIIRGQGPFFLLLGKTLKHSQI